MNTQNVVIGIALLVLGHLTGYFFGTSHIAQGNHGGMESAMHGMTQGLEGKSGDAFDKAFLEEMIVHHQGAIEMAEALLKNTTRPELQKLGADIITAQTGEVEIMRGWLAAWFK
jgi:uncharacterized protein (DUF305 family)